VIIVKPTEALVFGGRPDKDSGTVGIFVLFKEESFSRLIFRWSFDYEPGLANAIANNFFLEPISAIM